MSDRRPGPEEERAYYQEIESQKKLDRQAKKMARAYQDRRHPCNQDPCVCQCVRCVQARKYDQPNTHCKGR